MKSLRQVDHATVRSRRTRYGLDVRVSIPINKRRWHAQLFFLDGVHLLWPELVIHKDAGDAGALGLKLAERGYL